MVDLGFKEINEIPDGLLTVESTGLLELLGGPTLIHLQGNRKERSPGCQLEFSVCGDV